METLISLVLFSFSASNVSCCQYSAAPLFWKQRPIPSPRINPSNGANLNTSGRHLGNRVVDIHGRHGQLVGLGELIQTVHAGHRLLHDALDQLKGLWTLLEHHVGGITAVIKNLRRRFAGEREFSDFGRVHRIETLLREGEWNLLKHCQSC